MRSIASLAPFLSLFSTDFGICLLSLYRKSTKVRALFCCFAYVFSRAEFWWRFAFSHCSVTVVCGRWRSFVSFRFFLFVLFQYVAKFRAENCVAHKPSRGEFSKKGVSERESASVDPGSARGELKANVTQRKAFWVSKSLRSILLFK